MFVSKSELMNPAAPGLISTPYLEKIFALRLNSKNKLDDLIRYFPSIQKVDLLGTLLQQHTLATKLIDETTDRLSLELEIFSKVFEARKTEITFLVKFGWWDSVRKEPLFQDFIPDLATKVADLRGSLHEQITKICSNEAASVQNQVHGSELASLRSEMQACCLKFLADVEELVASLQTEALTTVDNLVRSPNQKPTQNRPLNFCSKAFYVFVGMLIPICILLSVEVK